MSSDPDPDPRVWEVLEEPPPLPTTPPLGDCDDPVYSVALQSLHFHARFLKGAIGISNVTLSEVLHDLGIWFQECGERSPAMEV